MTFEIHETEVDGVPTLWTDGPGPFTAILSFRVGAADEPPARRGITHLVEHLALGPLGVQAYDHNGAVEPIRTMFVVSGSPEEAVTFLRETTSALADLPTERILVERAVIRREAAEQGPSIGSLLRWYRYGSGGHGAIHEEEHGMAWLGPDTVRSWAAERFARENAVLVLNQAPPAGLKLELASGGRRWPAPGDTPPPWVPLPAAIRWQPAAAAMTFTLPRGTPANVGSTILHRRARSALRFSDGTVYDVGFDYDALDADTAHVLFGTEMDERNVEAVTGRLLELYDRLVADGPTAEELASEAASIERQFEHPDGRLGFLDFRALDRLLGAPAVSVEQLLEMRRTLRPEDVQETLGRAGASMLLASSAPNPAPGRLGDYPMWSPEAVTGDVVAPAGFALPGRGRKERLIVGADGVSLQLSKAETITIRYSDLVAAVHFSKDRLLVGADGFRIGIEAAAWKNGERVIQRIDAATPSHAFVCCEHTEGGLEDPEGRT